MKKKISHCHKHIAKVAKELAATNYDELMSQDILYKAWKAANPDCVRGPTVDAKKLKERYVTRKWGMYVTAARATLTLLLRTPIDESLKEEIMEILAQDSTLIRGRVNPATVAGAVVGKS